MQKLSYARLTQFAVLLLIAPALVSEIFLRSGKGEESGLGHMFYVTTIVVVTMCYFFANFFIARTFHRSGHAGKWPVFVAAFSAIVACCGFIPTALGLLEQYALYWEALGDIGFIGMGCVSAYAIGYDLLKTHDVSAREVWGSIALYLIVGVTFSYVYGLIAQFNSNAFSETFVAGVESRPDLIYFSFVTQMTVGYGDITPLSQLARNVVILHGAFGILYPPILIARLVNLFILKRSD